MSNLSWDGSHLGTSDYNFVRDHSMNIHGQFGFTQVSSLWYTYSFSIILKLWSIVTSWISYLNNRYFVIGHQGMLTAKFAFKWWLLQRMKILKIFSHMLKLCPVEVAILDFQSIMKNENIVKKLSIILFLSCTVWTWIKNNSWK